MIQKLQRVGHHDVVFYELDTQVQGPTVVITANLHGDECTGFGVIVELLHEIPQSLLKGKVILYPSLNPAGLQQYLRIHPEDGQDLNRLFPGKMLGGTSDRLVHAIWTSIVQHKPQLVLDLHTDSGASIPYVLIDRMIARSQKDMMHTLKSLAQATGLTCVHEYTTTLYRHYDLQKSLSGSVLNLLKCPALTLEVGPRRRIEPKYVTRMKKSVFGVLYHMNMVAKNPVHSPEVSGFWYRTNGPIVKEAGVFIPSCQPGDILAPKQKIGAIYARTGVLIQSIHVSQRSLVLSLPENCFIKSNHCCATLALPED